MIMDDEIKISYSEEDIAKMPMDEKLNTLVRFSISEHKVINQLSRLLTEPGTGICARIENINTRLNILWTVVLGAGSVIIIVMSIVKFLIGDGGS